VPGIGGGPGSPISPWGGSLGGSLPAGGGGGGSPTSPLGGSAGGSLPGTGLLDAPAEIGVWAGALFWAGAPFWAGGAAGGVDCVAGFAFEVLAFEFASGARIVN
jgi:hypothetical protein